MTKLTADHRRALRLLADNARGCTEAIMMAHGLKLQTIVDLTRDGLATATPEKVRAGGRTVEVTRVQLTDAGRCALMTCCTRLASRRRLWPFDRLGSPAHAALEHVLIIFEGAPDSGLEHHCLPAVWVFVVLERGNVFGHYGIKSAMPSRRVAIHQMPPAIGLPRSHGTMRRRCGGG